MIKSGLIFGAAMLLLVLLFSAGVSPLCALCVAVFAGMGAGYVAGVFDKPRSSAEATKSGAVAGAIAGGMAILGQIIAAVINGYVMTSTQARYYQSYCFPSVQSIDPTTIWVAQIAMGCCVGILNVGIAAGLGIAGSAIWLSISGKKTPTALPPAASI